jgi:hypothetical protein
MERESFEDEKIARILNNNFVAIKVDREERPDVDRLYMVSCHCRLRASQDFLRADGHHYHMLTCRSLASDVRHSDHRARRMAFERLSHA